MLLRITLGVSYIFLPVINCFATEVGAMATMDEVYCDVFYLTTGNIGTIVGFAVAFAGFIFLLLKGSKRGIALIVIGISVTAFPGLLNSFIMGMNNISSEGRSDFSISECPLGGVYTPTDTPAIDPMKALRPQSRTSHPRDDHSLSGGWDCVAESGLDGC